MINALSKAGIEIIEAGFLTDMPHSRDCSLYSSEDEIRSVCGDIVKSRIAAMIALGEKETDPAKLPDSKDSVIDIVRITFHNETEEMERAFRYARLLMEKGYQVCMQPVGTTSYTDIELVQLIQKVNELNPFAFYLVDTLGVLNKHDLLRFVYLIDNNLNPDIRIGFHSHNNLQMSFANTQEIIEFPSPRRFIVDSSVFGMGRGAGNLCTEIVTDFINKTIERKYDINPVLELIDEVLMPIYAATPWGYSAAYFLSASCGCHPNYSSYLMSRQTLHATSISAILSRIPPEKRAVYDEKVIENLYLSYQEVYIDDTETREKLKELIGSRTVLIIAPGKSIIQEKDKVLKNIQDKSPFVISVNFVPDIPCSLHFFSNRRRFDSVPDGKADKYLFTSNIKYRPENSLTVNYTRYLNKNRMIFDNAGLMLIELLISIGVGKIQLAGFDGFVANAADNYADPAQAGASEWEQLSVMNEMIEEQLGIFSRRAELRFITQTHYNIDNKMKGLV